MEFGYLLIYALAVLVEWLKASGKRTAVGTSSRTPQQSIDQLPGEDRNVSEPSGAVLSTPLERKLVELLEETQWKSRTVAAEKNDLLLQRDAEERRRDQLQREHRIRTLHYRFREKCGSHSTRFVIVTVIPTLLSALSMIIVHTTTSSWWVALSMLFLTALFSCVLLRELLFSPQDAVLSSRVRLVDEARRRKEEAIKRLSTLIRDAEIHGSSLRKEEYRLAGELYQEREAIRRESSTYSLLQADWRTRRGADFEFFLHEVFTNLGYHAELMGATGDQGVDLIVHNREGGLAVQAKGYEGSVGNSAVQQVYSGMAYHHCTSCAVITNSSFTRSARRLARRVQCMLIDEDAMDDFIAGRVFPRIPTGPPGQE